MPLIVLGYEKHNMHTNYPDTLKERKIEDKGTHKNEMKWNEMKSNQIKSNKIKCNKIKQKQNKIKQNKIKQNKMK